MARFHHYMANLYVNFEVVFENFIFPCFTFYYFMAVPYFPGGIIRTPNTFQHFLIPKGIHWLPKAGVFKSIQLPAPGQVPQGLVLPHGFISFYKVNNLRL